jgi:hypothetical protein
LLNRCGGPGSEPPHDLTGRDLPRKSRLAALIEHYSPLEDPRDVRRITHRLEGLSGIPCAGGRLIIRPLLW